MRLVFPFGPFCAVLIGWPAVASAESIYVDPIGGVMVSRGEGFYPIHEKTALGVGDVVVANPGSAARIVYPDGCVVEVLPGTIGRVADNRAPMTVAECNGSPRVVPNFKMRREIETPSGIGSIITKDAESYPTRPAGP
jgi:hypothetical protein